MEGAFQFEGIDPEEGTVVVEIRKQLLAPIANALDKIEYCPGAPGAILMLSKQFRRAAAVLYGEANAERCGFDLLETAAEDGA